jgi:hypothetical protein
MDKEHKKINLYQKLIKIKIYIKEILIQYVM